MKKKQSQPKPVSAVKEAPQKEDTEQKYRTDVFDNLGSKAVFVAIALLATMAFIVFKDFILLNSAYYYLDIGSDSYNFLYNEVKTVSAYLAEHGVPSWSYRAGMGQNMLQFCLRDPFDVIVYLAGEKNIIYANGYKEFIKVILTGLVFYYYLKTLGLSAFSRIVGSLFFAFGGFMIIGSGWQLFSFEVFCLGLLLLSVEQLLAGGKWWLMVLGFFLFAISQPFNLYLYGIFLGCYTLLRLYNSGYSLKSGSLFLAKMAGLGLIGLLIGGPLLVANVLQLLESPRGMGDSSYASILSAQPMFQVADKFQLGTSVMRFFASDLLGAGSEFKGWQNTLEAPLFYCGIPCLLLMPQVFQFLTKRERTSFFILILVWMLPIIFPYFRYAYWLFTGDYFRAYALIVAVIFMYFSLLALDKILLHRKINVIVLAVTVVVLFLLLNYPYFPEDGFINSAVFTFVCLMVLVHGGLLFFIGRKEHPEYLRYVFLGAVVIELLYFSNISVNDRTVVSAESLTQKTGYNDYTVEALKYINDRDKSFFRIDKNYASSTAIHYSLNDGMAQGYNGTSGYGSFNQVYYIRFLQLMGVSDRNNEQESRWAMGLTRRPILESANRVKYMLVKKDEVPLWRLIGDSVGVFGDVKVYRNKFLLPFGYSYRQYIKESVFEKLTITQKDFVTLKACVLRDENVSRMKGLTEFQLRDTIGQEMFNLDYYMQGIRELGRDSLVIDKFEETRISGKVNMSEDKMLYLSVPYDGGWQLKVDGKPQDIEIVFAGMSGIMLPRGQHSIEMVYKLRYFNTGLLMAGLGLLICGGLWFITRKKGLPKPISNEE